MKVYIGYKKEGTRTIFGVTVYDDTSKIVYSNIKGTEDMSKTDGCGKFTNILMALKWGVHQVKLQAQRGVLSEEEQVYIITDNKTVYSWFENGSSKKDYSVEFADLLREINFLINDVEILLSSGSTKKVTYKRKGTIEDTGLIKATDMFNS